MIVRAFPRLHLGLLDLGNATPRTYGGVGFMLDALPTEIEVVPGTKHIYQLNNVDEVGRLDVRAAIERMSKRYQLKGGTLEVRSLPPQHIGLGTKTSLVLAVLKAWQLHSKLKISVQELQRLSGRGGASGIGIHGFFRGGFLVDVGHDARLKNTLAPSGSQSPLEVPLLAARSRISSRWQICLLLADGPRYSG